jgi:hypothetical protein
MEENFKILTLLDLTADPIRTDKYLFRKKNTNNDSSHFIDSIEHGVLLPITEENERSSRPTDQLGPLEYNLPTCPMAQYGLQFWAGCDIANNMTGRQKELALVSRSIEEYGTYLRRTVVKERTDTGRYVGKRCLRSGILQRGPA